MKCNILVLAVVMLILSLLAGCASNGINIRTSPSSAKISLYAKKDMIFEGTSDLIDYKLNSSIVKQIFENENRTKLGIVVEKTGYRPYFRFMNLSKASFGQVEVEPVRQINLEALDTDLQLDVDPSSATGAKISFYSRIEDAKLGRNPISFPLGESLGGTFDIDKLKEDFNEFYNKYNSQIKFREDTSITLPWKASYTTATASTSFSKIKAIRVEAEDFLPKFEDFAVIPGRNNTKLIQLKKMNTVLKVLSDIDGVEIEDTKPESSFGYLGKTPLVRQFSYKECTREVSYKNEMKVPLILRAYKAGYIDQKIEVNVPFGEEISIKVSLKPRTNQITFQSDPEGVHVYVLRKKKETQYVKDESGSGKWEEKEVQVEKHLGTTPFTYAIDASDPLEHDDLLRYKKTGYVDAEDHFAIGVGSYLKVLTPAVVKER